MFTLEAVPVQSAGAVSPVPFVASFVEDRDPGHVVGGSGTASTAGIDGVDLDALISIDHGALRLAPAARPGWGRAALAWGPYQPVCGLTASVVTLAGPGRPPGTRPAGGLHDVLARVRAEGLAGGREGLGRWLFERWELGRAGRPDHAERTDRDEGDLDLYRDDDDHHDDRAEAALAVGLLGAARPSDAAAGGAAFRLRPARGALTLAAGHPDATDLVDALAGDRHQLVVIVRETGAVYAVGSWPSDGRGAGTIRPVLVDPTPLPDQVWAGVHHGGPGAGGHGAAVRIDDVRVVRPVALCHWWTSALVADRGPDAASAQRRADHGGSWRAAALAPGRQLVVLPADRPVGVTHAVVRLDQAEQRVGLAVRVDDLGRCSTSGADAMASGWVVTTSLGATVAERYCDGVAAERHRVDSGLTLGRASSIQIVDDGSSLRVLIDGRTVLGPLPAGDGVGAAVGVRCFDVDGGELIEFEAHPRMIELPAELRVDPPALAELTVERLRDGFEPRRNAFVDADGTPLAGRVIGDRHWQQTEGSALFWLDAAGHYAAVRSRPVAGRAVGRSLGRWRRGAVRSVCTVAWSDPASAELTVSLIGPGPCPGGDERRPGGLVFHQDRDHQLLVQTWRERSGAIWVGSSLSVDGVEHGGEAIRTSIGSLRPLEEPYDLRATFDGTCYVVSVDGAPVLYRRISDLAPSIESLRIERVGIVDGGTSGHAPGPRFLRFTAATAAPTNGATMYHGSRLTAPTVNTPTVNTPTVNSPTEQPPTANLPVERPTTAPAAKDDRV